MESITKKGFKIEISMEFILLSVRVFEGGTLATTKTYNDLRLSIVYFIFPQ